MTDLLKSPASAFVKKKFKSAKQRFLWFHQKRLKLFEFSHSSLVCQEMMKKKRFSKVVDKETVCLLFTRADSGEIKKTWFKISADVFLLFSPFEAKIAETRQQKGCVNKQKLDLRVAEKLAIEECSQRHNLLFSEWFIQVEIHLAAVIEFMERFAWWNVRSWSVRDEKVFQSH